MAAEKKSPLAEHLRQKAEMITDLLNQYRTLRYGDDTFRKGDKRWRKGATETFRVCEKCQKAYKEKDPREKCKCGGELQTQVVRVGTPPGHSGIPPQIMVASSPKNIYAEPEEQQIEESEEEPTQQQEDTGSSMEEASSDVEAGNTGLKIVNPLAQALVGLGEMTTDEAHRFELDVKYSVLTELGVEERYNCNVLLPWARQLAAHITYILETREIYCVVPGQNVLGNTEIQNVAVGSAVFDGEGLVSHVTSVNTKWYDGNIVEILPQILKIPIRITPEHHVLVLPKTFNRNGASIIKLLKKWRAHVTRKNSFKSAWIPAGNVEHGMYVGFPILKHDKNVTVLDLSKELKQNVRLRGEYVYNNAKKLGKGLKKLLPLTPDLAELCGFYVAEGCHGCKGIRFYFGKTSIELVRARRTSHLLEKVFGISSHVRDSTTTHATMVLANSALLDKLFASWFGNYAYSKRIPQWILAASDEFVKAFLKGAWEGDGHIRRTENGYTWFGYGTTSREVALGICALLIRLGIRPNVGMYQPNPNKRPIKSKHPDFKIMVQSESHILGNILGVKTHKTKSYSTAFYLDEKLWFPIGSVRTLRYSGTVWDVSLTPRNSFTLGPVIVHNSAEIKAIYPELLGDLEVARSTLDHLAYLLGRQHGLLSNRQFTEMMSKILHYAEVAKQAALQLADHHVEFVTAETSPLEGGPEIEWVFKETEGAPTLPKPKEKPKEESEEE